MQLKGVGVETELRLTNCTSMREHRIMGDGGSGARAGGGEVQRSLTSGHMGQRMLEGGLEVVMEILEPTRWL